MLQLLSNAFNDPNNPWYYVVGVIFLLLVLGALALYIILSKKFAKKADDGSQNAENTATDAPSGESDVQAGVDMDVENPDENSDKPQV